MSYDEQADAGTNSKKAKRASKAKKAKAASIVKKPTPIGALGDFSNSSNSKDMNLFGIGKRGRSQAPVTEDENDPNALPTHQHKKHQPRFEGNSVDGGASGDVQPEPTMGVDPMAPPSAAAAADGKQSDLAYAAAVAASDTTTALALMSAANGTTASAEFSHFKFDSADSMAISVPTSNNTAEQADVLSLVQVRGNRCVHHVEPDLPAHDMV